MHISTLVAPALAAGALALTAACGSSGPTAAGLPKLHGAELARPVSAPAGTFASTAGGSYDLAAHLPGHVTLLFFGYTHCPDECPTTMAQIGAALRSMPAETARQVQVLFVTSDPARDTLPALRTWLSRFDDGVPNHFVGLRTDVRTVDAYGAKVGVPLYPPKVEPDDYEVAHGDQVLGFGHDGTARVAWLPDSITVPQYAADITALTRQSA